MLKKKYCFFLLFVLHISLWADLQPQYFSDPSVCSPKHLVQELKEKPVDMCWYFTEDSYFRFVSENSEVYFEVVLGTLPDIYDDFLVRMQDRLIEIESAETLSRAFSYKVSEDGSEEINHLQQAVEETRHPDTESYTVAHRRIIEDASPTMMDQKTLEKIICNEHVLFYTGAGLSVDSGIPDMDELERELGFLEEEGFICFLDKALSNPQALVKKIRAFHDACFLSPPTQAHFALKELALFKNVRIVTENLDCLHEKTGVSPYRIDAQQLRDQIGEEAVAQFDHMICLGLENDDKGFLGWYKELNPSGKIIAIDVKQPSYLGDEDSLVVGDLQKILPSIQTHILEK